MAQTFFGRRCCTAEGQASAEEGTEGGKEGGTIGTQLCQICDNYKKWKICFNSVLRVNGLRRGVIWKYMYRNIVCVFKSSKTDVMISSPV